MDLQKELEEVNDEYAATARAIKALEGRRHKLYNKTEVLKKQIADAEVTYSIGDKFELCGRVRMLTETEGCVHMHSLDDGRNQSGSIRPANLRKITQAEFDAMRRGMDYIRTYDARKQCKC